MSSYFITVGYRDRTMNLHVPVSWNVARLKELILMYHPESPSVQSQVLVYKFVTLKNSETLKELFAHDSKPELSLQVETVPDVPEHLTGFKSELFKHREEEYIKKYDLAKQLLLDTHHKLQESSQLPQNSLITSLPISHPEFQKRIRSLAIASKPPSIRLRKLPFSIYLDFWTIFRWALFSLITQNYLGASLPKIYYLFVIVCYLLSIRHKIDQHLQKELRKLPRDYLMKTLPDRYKSELDQEAKISILTIVYETIRALILSFLPWFDPIDYSNKRSYLFRRVNS